MNLALMGSQIRAKLREGTLLASVRRQLRGHVKDEFDRARGTDTGGLVPLWKLSVDSENLRFGNRYETNDSKLVEEVLLRLPRDFTFIDIGCGKGRVLLIARELGFQRVMGVEFAADLVATARRNAAIRHTTVEIIHGDAADFEFPQENIIIFLYNPFGLEVLSRVVERIKRIRNRIVVVYINPLYAAPFDAFLRRTWERPDAIIWSN